MRFLQSFSLISFCVDFYRWCGLPDANISSLITSLAGHKQKELIIFTHSGCFCPWGVLLEHCGVSIDNDDEHESGQSPANYNFAYGSEGAVMSGGCWELGRYRHSFCLFCPGRLQLVWLHFHPIGNSWA